MAIEIPQYDVLKKNGRFELRKYKSYITASVKITADSYNSASNKAFRLLADYIFGNNTKSTKIAMTASVTSEKSETIAMTAPVAASRLNSQTYVISFTMPSKYSMESLPRPNNNAVIINFTPSHEEAVVRFSGYTDEGKIEELDAKLREWASENQIKLTGDPTVSRYDPPWKPGFLRRNEISLKSINSVN
ncbi:heme-binding protein [Candidatus Saccharibacteria bacterium]|nr:heme-binding protein [Candidatus Saccharibacteria bacterium]